MTARMGRIISKKDRGIDMDPDSVRVRLFNRMLEDGRVEQIQNMYWPSHILPELYVDARKDSYWLNMKIADPIGLRGGAKIKLIKLGKLRKVVGPLDHYEDHYDSILDGLASAGKKQGGSNKKQGIVKFLNSGT